MYTAWQKASPSVFGIALFSLLNFYSATGFAAENPLPETIASAPAENSGESVAQKSATNTTTEVTTEQKTATETASTPETATETKAETEGDINAPALTAAEEKPEVKDPYEGFNRAMFAFNDKLDKFVLKPIATFYDTIMPRPLNEGVHNFFLNIGNLPNIANDILQFHFYQMANDMWRLGVNSTIGIGGLFDVGSRIGLMPYSNDFGMTLATWGYQNSNYLVLPFFGPNTVRDMFGIPVDYYAFSIYPHIRSWRTRYSIYGLGVIDRRAQLLHYQEVMEEASLDKYVFQRNAYMQHREYQLEENQRRTAAYLWKPNKPTESTATANGEPVNNYDT